MGGQLLIRNRLRTSDDVTSGIPRALPQATLGFDLHRMSWFIRAMIGVLDEDEWTGTVLARRPGWRKKSVDELDASKTC
ncbi:hypothetical protein D3C80_164490 [compost metagenome]